MCRLETAEPYRSSAPAFDNRLELSTTVVARRAATMQLTGVSCARGSRINIVYRYIYS
jgi:hypothetical protein